MMNEKQILALHKENLLRLTKVRDNLRQACAKRKISQDYTWYPYEHETNLSELEDIAEETVWTLQEVLVRSEWLRDTKLP